MTFILIKILNWIKDLPIYKSLISYFFKDVRFLNNECYKINDFVKSIRYFYPQRFKLSYKTEKVVKLRIAKNYQTFLVHF